MVFRFLNVLLPAADCTQGPLGATLSHTWPTASTCREQPAASRSTILPTCLSSLLAIITFAPHPFFFYSHPFLSISLEATTINVFAVLLLPSGEGGCSLHYSPQRTMKSSSSLLLTTVWFLTESLTFEQPEEKTSSWFFFLWQSEQFPSIKITAEKQMCGHTSSHGAILWMMSLSCPTIFSSLKSEGNVSVHSVSSCRILGPNFRTFAFYLEKQTSLINVCSCAMQTVQRDLKKSVTQRSR